MTFRVNYGNGQVSSTIKGRKAAQRALVEARNAPGAAGGFMFLEFRDCGEWFPARIERPCI